MALSPSCSPPLVHQLKISSFAPAAPPAAGAAVAAPPAAGAAVAAPPVGAAVLPQADRINTRVAKGARIFSQRLARDMEHLPFFEIGITERFQYDRDEDHLLSALKCGVECGLPAHNDPKCNCRLQIADYDEH